MICIFTAPPERERRRSYFQEDQLIALRQYGRFCQLLGFCLGLLFAFGCYVLLTLWR